MASTASVAPAHAPHVGFVSSSIGAKVVMAVSGMMLTGFVLVHMIGNLQIFLGPEALNRYGHFLQGLGELLWVARLVLLTAVVAHIASAARLVILNQQARPVPYAHSDYVQVKFASRTMPITGLIVLAFIIYHIGHFTLGKAQPELYHLIDELGHYDIYAMVVLGFQNWFVTGIYVVANALLALHLSHGVSSMFQSLGLTAPAWRPLIDYAGPVVGLLVLIGNLAIPLACILGLVEIPTGVLAS